MSISYFYPPQPLRIWPNTPVFSMLAKNPLWDGEIKYNGWRILIFKFETITIYNRHSTIIDIDPTPFEPLFKKIPSGTVFDGELIDKRTKTLKNIMILFDCPYYKNENVQSKPLKERRQFLEHFSTAPGSLVNKPSAQVFKIQQFKTNLIQLYKDIELRNNDLEEGLVLKNINSKYRSHPSRGIDVVDWMKVKKIGDHAYN